MDGWREGGRQAWRERPVNRIIVVGSVSDEARRSGFQQKE
jgi:hypothetical protein